MSRTDPTGGPDPRGSAPLASHPRIAAPTGHAGVDYPLYHRDRANLAIHAVAVPLFVAGTAMTLGQLALGRWAAAGLAALVPVLAFAAQAIGHRREPTAPAPFAGPGDFVARVVLEQSFRFWRFALGGGWWRAWKAAGADRT